ncbi:MAG: hypothetical protein Q4D51_08515, partial [Eubacteriales bacterium]|nr:hypothetical protein [Eubacteriales bacterium]
MNYSNVDVAKLQAIKDVLLIIISICVSNLLLEIVIEVNSKNSIVTDIILNDVVCSPEFYKNMDLEKKQEMFNSLQNELFFRNDIKNSIVSDITRKIDDFLKDYYYESCSYIVTC